MHPTAKATDSRFAAYLASLLKERGHGGASELSRKTGLPLPHLTKIVSGQHTPREKTLRDLLNGFDADVQRRLLVYYLQDQIPPDKTGEVRVSLVGVDAEPMDRLNELLQYLNPSQRRIIADLLEVVGKSPEKGWAMLEALAEYNKPMEEPQEEQAPAPKRRKVVYPEADERLGFGESGMGLAAET